MTKSEKLLVRIERVKRLISARNCAEITEVCDLPFSIAFHAVEMVNSPLIDEQEKEAFAFRVAKALVRLADGEDSPALVNPHGESSPAFSAE